MSFQQELSSWFAPNPPSLEVAEIPALQTKAPNTPQLHLTPGQPTIIIFLRHCGCPFAEKTYLNLREAARAHKNISFKAISHSSGAATDAWLKSLPQHGSETSNLEMIVDEQTEIYRAWGLGVATYAHVLSPGSMYSLWKLGQSDNIWNRPTESGSRWQMGGFFAVDGEGVVRWGRAAERADDVTDFREAIEALEGGEKVKTGGRS